MTNYFITNADIIKNMYHKSGKDYNDFGRYHECDASPDFNYLIAYVSSEKKLPIPISLGLCVPTVCKIADLNELKPYIMSAINS